MSVRYAVLFNRLAERDIRRLDKSARDRIIQKIELLSADLSGDVKRLTEYTPSYCLRVGDWRVLFELEGSTITVYRVLHRSKAYE